MAYIIVVTDNGRVVFKKHHSEYPVENNQPETAQAKLLNDLAGAVLQAETYSDDQCVKSAKRGGMIPIALA